MNDVVCSVDSAGWHEDTKHTLGGMCNTIASGWPLLSGVKVAGARRARIIGPDGANGVPRCGPAKDERVNVAVNRAFPVLCFWLLAHAHTSTSCAYV